MFIIGVEYIVQEDSLVIEFIKKWVQENGEKTLAIAPNSGVCYKFNKKVSLREYCHHIKEDKKIDLLLIQITKQGIENRSYDQINFDVVVVTTKFIKNQFLKRNRLSKYQFNQFKAKYYIVPEHIHIKEAGYVTYGWHKDANVSIASVENNIDGGIDVQCSLETCIPTLKGTILLPGEFSLEAATENVGCLVAAATTALIYGIDLKNKVNE